MLLRALHGVCLLVLWSWKKIEDECEGKADLAA
jgi:hypothetical protein